MTTQPRCRFDAVARLGSCAEAVSCGVTSQLYNAQVNTALSRIFITQVKVGSSGQNNNSSGF